jgi:hypothetical protein
VDDIGTVFKATIKDEDGVVVDVSGAGTLELVFRKPDGTAVVKTAVFTTDGEDGVIQYITIADDMDTEGEWRVQGYVKIATSEFHSDVHRFRVYPNLSRPVV